MKSPPPSAQAVWTRCIGHETLAVLNRPRTSANTLPRFFVACVICTLTLLPSSAVAQAENYRIQGIGGVTLRTETLGTERGAIYGVGFGLRVHRNLEVTGELGRLPSGLPKSIRTNLENLVDRFAGGGFADFFPGVDVDAVFSLESAVFYGTGGVRFLLPQRGRLQPYAEASAGFARTDVEFNAKLEFRSDLGFTSDFPLRLDDLLFVAEDEKERRAIRAVEQDISTDFLLAFGGGLTVAVAQPLSLDVGYRYNRIFGDAIATNLHQLYGGVNVVPTSRPAARRGTVKLTKTGLTAPQDDGLASCCEPGMLGTDQPDSA